MNEKDLNSFYNSIQKSVEEIGSYSNYLKQRLLKNDAFNYLHTVRYVRKDVDKMFFKEDSLSKNGLVGIIITNESIRTYKSLEELSRDAKLFVQKDVFPVVISEASEINLPKGIVAYNPDLEDSIELIHCTPEEALEFYHTLPKRPRVRTGGVIFKKKNHFIGPGPNHDASEIFIGPGHTRRRK
jgi:hypothetical protein